MTPPKGTVFINKVLLVIIICMFIGTIIWFIKIKAGTTYDCYRTTNNYSQQPDNKAVVIYSTFNCAP